MYKLLLLALGGATGTVFRYALTNLIYKYFSPVFPWGTFIVNLAGSFIIGLLWGVTEKFTLSPLLKLFLFVGILGGFTTFSSFVLESFNMLREGEYNLVFLNILASNILGLTFVFAGFILAKYLVAFLK